MKALIVVVKNPLPGAVKTRLQTRYSPKQAAQLYTAFVRDVLQKTQSLDIDRRIIAYDPPDAEDAVRSLCGNDWQYTPQAQKDLGTRMHTALIQQLDAGATAAVLIGTDIPSLPPDHITEAFTLLNETDVVLGPSTDSGYYLVGISKPAPEIFQNITWSTVSVLTETLALVKKNHYSFGLVPPWFDVDTPEELDILIAQAQATELATGIDPLPHTHAYLSALT